MIKKVNKTDILTTKRKRAGKKSLYKYEDSTPVEQVCTKWESYYTEILTHDLMGRELKEIAKLVGKSIATVRSVRHFKEYQDRYARFYEPYGFKAVETIKQWVPTLLLHKINLALNADKQTVQSESTSWLLGKIPELKEQLSQTIQNTNVYTPTDEDNKRIAGAQKDLLEIQRILRDGNPNVLDTSEEGNEDDILIEQVDRPPDATKE